MGNCQAAEAAAVLIQHPGGGRTERAYWALSAGAVMAANPGHYVAAVIATTQPGDASGSASVKHLKLLRPDDTLLLGRVYRLVSFEEVLREFASKRHVKLSRVTIRAKDEDEEGKPAAKHRRRRASGSGGRRAGAGERKESERSLAKVMRRTEEEVVEPEPEPAGTSSSGGPVATKHDGHADAAAADLDAELEALLPHGALLGRRAARQWRPALQSIAEG